jgi:hypothetical protein
LPPRRYLFFERAAHGLNHVAFDLIFQSVGIDDQSAIVRDDDALDAHRTACAIHVNARDHRDISFIVFVLRERDAQTFVLRKRCTVLISGNQDELDRRVIIAPKSV